jgi:endogenous inhibitor of DNA gyrase (YacG/DUF329 family)
MNVSQPTDDVTALSSEPTTVKCPACAEEVPAEAIKCKHCGTSVRGEETKVVRYHSSATFRREAPKMAAEGWTVVSQSQATAHGLHFAGKGIVVTWSRPAKTAPKPTFSMRVEARKAAKAAR